MNLNAKKPLLLHSTGKDYLWGGQRLNTEFAKGIDLDPLAETWECSTHPDGPSFLEDGTSLIEYIKENPEVLGTRHEGLIDLPILIKFIDAKNDLSVQVHPSDEYALKNEGQLGKTEMWYVLDATPDAKLVYGFKEDCTEADVRAGIEHGTILNKLQVLNVRKNDVFFIPSGTVHAIGAGALIAEIQEASNLTYRLYDYDRVDKNGKKRELHADKALKVMNLKSSATPRQPMRVLKYKEGVASELLCRCKYFEVYRMLVNTERRAQVQYRADEASFRVLLCIGGCGVINFAEENIIFYKGDCIFVPADSEILIIHGKAKFLDIRG